MSLADAWYSKNRHRNRSIKDGGGSTAMLTWTLSTYKFTPVAPRRFLPTAVHLQPNKFFSLSAIILTQWIYSCGAYRCLSWNACWESIESMISNVDDKCRPTSNSTSSQLPRFPVPPLERTLHKYLKTVRPLLSDEDFSNTKNVVNKFECEEGVKLQLLLEERGRQRENWLDEWWLNETYLKNRNPLGLSSSGGSVVRSITFDCESDRFQFTAHVITTILQYFLAIKRGELEPEMMRDEPLCMHQYNVMFGTTRIPLANRDCLLFHQRHLYPHNILVLSNNNIFSLDVINEKDEILPCNAVLKALEEIVEKSKSPGQPVGILTCADRDIWARVYSLFQLDENNAHVLSVINRSLFAVCIDNPLSDGIDNSKNGLILHGGGYERGNSANRWFDKTIQIVIGDGSDGVGVCLEHGAIDGMPFAAVTDLMHGARLTQRKIALSADSPKPTKLEFNIDATVYNIMCEIGTNTDKLVADLDLNSFRFDGFGKEEIKKCQMSPDSFIQVAIQYAYFKVHGKTGTQYESGSLRKFKYGRTEVIRACLDEVVTFCQSSQDADVRLSLLKSAVNAHKRYGEEVHEGLGVDKHLLGLKLIAGEKGFPVPKIFTDLGYLIYTHYHLSTSNVPTQGDVMMYFSPVVEDGYGCWYGIKKDSINFMISTWRHCNLTNPTKFQAALVESLLEMKDVASHQH